MDCAVTSPIRSPGFRKQTRPRSGAKTRTASGIQPFAVQPSEARCRDPIHQGIASGEIASLPICAPHLAQGAWPLILGHRRLVVAGTKGPHRRQQFLLAEMLDGPLVHALNRRASSSNAATSRAGRHWRLFRQHHSGPQPGVILGIKPAVRNVVDLHVAGECGGVLGEPRVERRRDEQMAARRRRLRSGNNRRFRAHDRFPSGGMGRSVKSAEIHPCPICRLGDLGRGWGRCGDLAFRGPQRYLRFRCNHLRTNWGLGTLGTLSPPSIHTCARVSLCISFRTLRKICLYTRRNPFKVPKVPK